MKFEFWKHQPEILFIWPFMFFLASACLIVGIILPAIETFYWPLLFAGLLSFSISIYIGFCQEKTMSKVIYTENEIILKRFKKEILRVKWDDLINVKATLFSKSYYLSFVTEDKQIDVTLTKKMYQAIMLVCPYESIKTRINNIEQFKWFHRKDN